MSKDSNQEKNNYITKINKVNNKLNKINHLLTKKNITFKSININKIFSKNNNNPKKSSDTVTINPRIHKKIISNIEDYNNLVKLNISNKLKKFPLNKITKDPVHRRILTERKISDINNTKKRNGNRFALINTRNKKYNDEYRVITEYFYKDKENKERTKDFLSQHITQKSITNIDSDFNKAIIEASNKLIIKTLKKKELKKNTQIILRNTDTPNKKRFMKYLKANNLYNRGLDNSLTHTHSNSKLKKKEFSDLNHLKSFDLPGITNLSPKNNSNNNFNMTNFGYSFDLKKQTIFRNRYKNDQRKILKNKFFYNNILEEKTSFNTRHNYNLKKYFPKIMNNLTIDKIIKETKKKDLSKIKYKKIILKNSKINDISSNLKEKLYLTTQNSFKDLISPKNIKKINIKNKYEIKNKNLWKLKINLDKNSKLKIAKYLKQKKYTKLNSTKKSEEESAIKVKNIFSLTKKGFWQPGIEKPNQDSFFIVNNINTEPNNYFIGVCDGHGKYGKEVSSFISTNLPNNLKKNIHDSKINLSKDSLSNISEVITKAFTQTNISLNLDSNIDISSSGSTCSSIILTSYRIISINLGDSRCVLGKYNSDNNIWSYVNLTRDHKPKEEDEKERIIKKGGKISKEKDEFGNSIGIMRIWKKDGGNIGLALTRSFGDEIMSKIGVSCEPEIREFILGKDFKFIVLGTDGLWEFISNQECVDIVKEFYEKDDIQGATNYLYKEASKRWIIEQDVVDDITIILIFLD